MKKFIYPLLLILCVSCDWGIDPWGNYNSDKQKSESSDPPESTDPSVSGVTVEDENSSEDNIANTEFDGTLSIVFSGNGATVSGSVKDVNVTKTGARVTVTNEGSKKVKYILSGQSDDGCFKLYGSKKQAVVLSDLTLTNTKGAAVNIQSKKRTFIVLEGTSALADGAVDSSGNYPEETDDEDMKAVLFSEGQIIFSGTGSLSVTAKGKAGITSDDYVRFMTGTNVSVSSSNGHGVRGKDAIIVSGGTIDISLASTANGKKCFTTDSLMYIGGGKITLDNKASAYKENSQTEPTGAACIKADQLFVIQGGELTATASGKGGKCISGDKNGYFEGGKVNVKASGSNYGNTAGSYAVDNSVSAKAIKFDGNLEFSGAEVVAAASAHEAIESKGTIYISGGVISASSKDDAINSSSTMTISDGVVYACSTGNDGLDANGNLIIKGGTVFAIGSGNPEVGIDANTEKGYKLYLQSGNVIAIGGLESGSSVSQAVISTSWTRNTVYSLCDGDNAIFSFKAPSSGGTGLYMSAPSLKSGSKYKLKTSATLSGVQSYLDGIISIGGTATGGESTSVSAEEYTSTGGVGGGGFGPGGGGPGGGGPGGMW